ncbi:hypothetical protein CAEBREN_05983 [Caenorhabditis brenneri]|uniref:Uncharacterized protein n=1 Tax=Caenorhabditis brenneri TaxID=135651 RepID=G0N1S1_CAEBE|nr:hypothetical protein CAEBREN_05983 [Caenorhabditis brenneri]
MGSTCEDELCASILLIYCSDNDSPDKFFPADPSLVQAHRDAQNEPKPPPAPPASPESGIATPSTEIPSEFWQSERSSTPSPTFDVPMAEVSMSEDKQDTEIEQELDISQLSISQNSNDEMEFDKKVVTFSMKVDLVEYKPNITNKQFKRFIEKIKKRDKKRRERILNVQRNDDSQETRRRFWPTASGREQLIRKIASTIGITPKSKTYRTISTIARRVKSFTSRIIS